MIEPEPLEGLEEEMAREEEEDREPPLEILPQPPLPPGPMVSIPTVALLPPSPQRSGGLQSQPQMQPPRPPGELEIQNLQMLLAMFKSRNLELIDERGRLMSEIEDLKQNLMILQNASGDPGMIAGIMRGGVSSSAAGGSFTPVYIEDVSPDIKRSRSKYVFDEELSVMPEGSDRETIVRCAEFARELERMPELPGVIEVEDISTRSFGDVSRDAGGSHSKVAPCIFNQ